MKRKGLRPTSAVPPSTVRAALYIRVSTDAQAEEGYSIDAQKELLLAHCKSKEIDQHAFYIDAGYTGSNLDRPALTRMIEDIRNGAINLVVVYKLDRLSRSQRDTLYLIEDVLNVYGAAFTSLKESLDTSTSMGRAVIGILSAFAQLERETIYERTRMGMKERVKNGLWPGGGKPPFGYRYDDATGALVPSPDAAQVRRMFELAKAGHAPDAIARSLGMKYDMPVRNALRRRTYLGVIPYLGEEFPGKHPPLVSEADFEEVADMLSGRAGRRMRRETPYLLSGLLVCGKCGAKMRYQKWGQGVKIYCYSQQRSKAYLVRDPHCDNARVDAVELEALVLDRLFAHGIESEAAELPGPAPDPAQPLREALEQSKRRLKRLYALYADGDDALLATIADEKKRGLALSAQLEQADSPKPVSPEKQAMLRTLAQLWPHMTPGERRTAVVQSIRQITVTDEAVEIDFLF